MRVAGHTPGRTLLLVMSVVAATATARADEVAPSSTAGEEGIARKVVSSARHPWMGRGDLRDVAPELRALYRPEGALLWFDGERPGPALRATAEALAGAGDLGIDPAELDADRLGAEARAAEAGAAGTARERALLDTALSASVTRYLRAVLRGRVAPGRAGRTPGLAARLADLAPLVRQVAATGRLGEVVASLEPRYPAYAGLKSALARERAATVPGPVPALPRGRKVSPGDTWEGVPAVRARLAALGDLPAEASPPLREDDARHDDALAAAVRRFQWRHGLQADGVIGRRTLEAMAVPPARRARQIELALERWRWLPDPGPRLVLVEIPRAELSALQLDPASPPLRMRVIVGASTGHSTPMLVAPIESVVFRPYWVVPRAIVTEEILPLERKKPGWLARHDMEIVERVGPDAVPLAPTPEVLARLETGALRLQRRPGPRNDMGDVKFVVRDPEGIELHGTPHRDAFAHSRRDRSHGCVRVEDADALASWVLAGEPGWDDARIAAAKADERTTTAKLRAPVPVVLVYATASVDPDGTVHYRDDIYGLDGLLEKELARYR